MPDILHDVNINATPEKVYRAITQEDAFKAWWTVDSKVSPQVGNVNEFSFYNGMVTFKLPVTKLEANKHVHWDVNQGGPGWENTRITWDIESGENGTVLHFGHRGFASTEGGYAGTNFNWAWYLISLKKYLETGTGDPHDPAQEGS